MEQIRLDLSREQFEALLQTVYFAAMCNAGDDCEAHHALPQQIDSITDLVLRKAVESGWQAEDRAEALSLGEVAALEKELEEDEEIAEVYGHHVENVFWDELIHQLVTRDLSLKYGEEYDPEFVPVEEQDALFEHYEKEISAHGLQNFVLRRA